MKKKQQMKIETFDEVNNKFLALYNHINAGYCFFVISYFEDEFNKICEDYEALEETQPDIVYQIQQLIIRFEELSGLNAEELVKNENFS